LANGVVVVMEKTYKPNSRYPLQDHLVVDIENNVLEFPRKNTKKCQHMMVEIDTKALELVCKKCGAKVNPVLWIKDSVSYFTRIQQDIADQRERLKEDEAELKKRSRTRCQHCTKMTAINLKHHNFQILG